MIRSFLTAHTHALGPKSKKPEGFRSSGFCFRLCDQSTIRAATPLYRKKLLRNANRCGVRIGTCAKANRHRQTPTHRVAATGYRADALRKYLRMHKYLVPNFDQKLPIDLGKFRSAECTGLGDRSVIRIDQRSSRADQRSSQTPRGLSGSTAKAISRGVFMPDLAPLGQVALIHGRVRLEPLSDQHIEPLRAACAKIRTFGKSIR